MAKYSWALVNKIFALAAQGKGIYEICERVGIEYSTHWKWWDQGRRDAEADKNTEKRRYFETWETIKGLHGEGLIASNRTLIMKNVSYDENQNVVSETTDSITFTRPGSEGGGALPAGMPPPGNTANLVRRAIDEESDA